MPDFSKMQEMAKPRSSMQPQVTKAMGFELMSDQRSANHKREMEVKLRKEQEEMESRRRFKAQPMPDYSKLKPVIMPSDRPLTQA